MSNRLDRATRPEPGTGTTPEATGGAAAPVGAGARRPRRSRSGASLWAWRLVTLALILAAWQAASGRIVDSLFISSPVEVVRRLVDVFADGSIWPHIGETYSNVAVGYLLAAGIGICAGLLLGRMRFLANVLEPFVMAAYSIPKITLAPLFILWLGIGPNSKIAVAFLSALFLVFFATYTGTKNINEELVVTGRLLGANRWDLVRRVYVPQTIPFILDGLRTALPFAVIGAIVGEFMASNVGLGFYILRASSNLDATGAFAGIIILVVGVTLMNWILQTVEARLLKWKPANTRRGPAAA